MAVCTARVARCLLWLGRRRRRNERLEVVVDLNRRSRYCLAQERVDLVQLWSSADLVDAAELCADDLRHLVEQVVHRWPRSNDPQTE